MGEYENAISTWKKLLQVNPRNDNILARIGDVYLKLGNDDEAKQCYHRVLARSRNKYALLGLNRILRKEGEYDKAIRNYKLILSSDPKDERALRGLEESTAEKQTTEKESPPPPAQEDTEPASE